MTDHGSYLTAEADEADLKELLKTVQQGGRPIRILEQGRAVADLTPLPKKRELEPVDPKLKVDFAPDYDPCEGISEEDWPAHLR